MSCSEGRSEGVREGGMRTSREESQFHPSLEAEECSAPRSRPLTGSLLPQLLPRGSAGPPAACHAEYHTRLTALLRQGVVVVVVGRVL